MRREWKIIGDVRGKGLMIAVELIDGDQDETDEGSIRPLNCRAVTRIKHDCLKMGLLLGVGGVRSNVSVHGLEIGTLSVLLRKNKKLGPGFDLGVYSKIQN